MTKDHRRELLTGDFPQLEVAFLNRVRALRSEDPLAPIIVLVPTTLLRQHLAVTLVDHGIPHLNVRFCTFAGLVRDLSVATTLNTGQTAIPRFADELLMAQACDSQGDRFYFKRLGSRPGLHRTLLGTIQDLKEAGADLPAFEAALSRISGMSPSSRGKLDSLLAVWQNYEALKEKHRLIDDADLHEIAGNATGDASTWSDAAAFIVYGIYDFKRMQARLILRVAQCLPATVFFPFEDTPAWDYARPSLELMRNAGFKQLAVPTGTPSRSELLQRMCDQLFAPSVNRAQATPVSYEDTQATNPLEIVSVPGETREALELPRIVFQLARNESISFHEVGVLIRSPGSLDHQLREAFQLAGLPARMPKGVALRETRAGRALLLMIQALAEDYSRRDVMELLTFADLDYESMAGSAEPPTALWDALTMRAGIVRGRDQWLHRLARLRDRLSRAKHERETDPAATPEERGEVGIDPAVVECLIHVMKHLFDCLEEVARSRTWNELIDRTSHAYQSIVRPGIERDQVMELLGNLRRLEGLIAESNMATLARLTDESLRVQSASESWGDAGGTTLCALMQARGVPYRAVIVPGMIERSFPQLPTLDPILLDHEREKLNSAFRAAAASGRAAPPRGTKSSTNIVSRLHDVLPPQLPLKGAQSLEERLLFRLAVGAARERLIFTYPRIETDSGRERVPSYFLLRAIEAIRPDTGEPSNVPASSTGIDTKVGCVPVSLDRQAKPDRGRRRKHAVAHDQLVLSFLAEDHDVVAPAPGAVEASAAPQPSPAARRVASGSVSLQQWRGFRRVSLWEFAPPPVRAVTRFEFDLGHALAASQTAEERRTVLAAFAYISGHFARGVQAESIRWGRHEFTAYDGFVQDKELLEVLRLRSPLRSPISPSRIEDYARCPFHYYMHNVLSLEPLEEPELLARSDPAAKGKLVHNILAEFMQRMKDTDRLPLTASCERDLVEIAKAQLDEFEQSGGCGPGLTWQVERQQLEQFFRDFLAREITWQQETGYRPGYFELHFGRQETPENLCKEPACFELGDGRSVQFHGVIDRVDISKDGKRIYVIDYKGRKIPLTGKDGFGFGTAVQLPIYLLGAQAALAPIGKFHLCGGQYISYHPRVEPHQVGPLNDQAQDRLRTVLRTIVDGIHTGLFMQYTGQEACGFCPFDRVCMGTQETLVELKQGDSAASEFLQMKRDFSLAGER